jgi:hypothetical protein
MLHIRSCNGVVVVSFAATLAAFVLSPHIYFVRLVMQLGRVFGCQMMSCPVCTTIL